jgi:hypothetical protein
MPWSDGGDNRLYFIMEKHGMRIARMPYIQDLHMAIYAGGTTRLQLFSKSMLLISG